MGDIGQGCQISVDPQLAALLAVAEAIVSHRDLPSLFHDRAPAHTAGTIRLFDPGPA